MADSFTIRAEVGSNSTTFAQTTVDLGAYISAPAKKLLKINSVSCQLSVDGAPSDDINLAANKSELLSWQLTTQSQTAIVNSGFDKSVITSGKTYFFNSSGTASVLTGIHDTTDRNDEQWTNGYLVATPNMYIGVDMSAAFASGNIDVQLVLECEVVSATEARVFALSLSQQ